MEEATLKQKDLMMETATRHEPPTVHEEEAAGSSVECSSSASVVIPPTKVVTTLVEEESSPPRPNKRKEEKLQETAPAPPQKSKEEDFIIFHCVSYLGAAKIQEPKSEPAIQRTINFLSSNSSSERVVKVSLQVPLHSDGFVVVHDPLDDNNDPDPDHEVSAPLSRLSINQILFFARGGGAGADSAASFAFTCSHGETLEESIYQCHVFRCDVPEALTRVFTSFARAFDSAVPIPRLTPDSESASSTLLPETFHFEVSLEFKEDDGRGNYTPSPRTPTNHFKLRSCTSKHIVLVIQQVHDHTPELIVERCFGLLLSPGRHVRHSDMNLVEMLSWSIGPHTATRKSYTITGQWDANDPAFEPLNRETLKDSNIFLTVAVDLVVGGVQEPLRFSLEAGARIYPAQERFWSIGRRCRMTNLYGVQLRGGGGPNAEYEFVSNTGLGEVDRNKANFTQTFTSFIRSRSGEMGVVGVGEGDGETDSDEEPQSGVGTLTKECSDEQISSWSEIVAKWPGVEEEAGAAPRPKQLTSLVREGIPDTIRGEMWLRLASAGHLSPTIMDTYRVLLSRHCPSDEVIRRDITRTFSANDYFRESGGVGQELLYKLSKAYSLYDVEVGYCQGLTFIGAALLLQMPEEQSFTLLIKIMYAYGFRDLYRDGFENLRMRLYQLDRLIEERLPEIHTHFNELGIESHMYASQWFLTLFTAKFPLILVFRIMDLLLLEGSRVLFQVAVALLATSRRELLTLDFEGVLKYFRITLPKKYRKPDTTNQLVKECIRIKVKKLARFEQEYSESKKVENGNPLERVQLENRRLIEDMLRSEHIITELVLTKVNYEECLLTMEEDLGRVRAGLKEAEEFNTELKGENCKVKELFQREVRAYDVEAEKKSGIICEYKRICSKLSSQLEQEEKSNRERLAFLQSNICEPCTHFVSTALSLAKSPSNNDPSPSGSASGSPTSNANTNTNTNEEEISNELAKTKIALAEAECRNEDLVHQISLLQAEVESFRSSSGPGRLWRAGLGIVGGAGGGGSRSGGVAVEENGSLQMVRK